MSTYLITIPGFRDGGDHADEYPDDFEDFEGTEEELIAYIVEQETAYQTHRNLWMRDPTWGAGAGKLSKRIWDKVVPRESASCDRWCRAVVETRPVPGVSLDGVLAVAKERGAAEAAARIAAAEAKCVAEDAVAAEQRETKERTELARLAALYPDALKGPA